MKSGQQQSKRLEKGKIRLRPLGRKMNKDQMRMTWTMESRFFDIQLHVKVDTYSKSTKHWPFLKMKSVEFGSKRKICIFRRFSTLFNASFFKPKVPFNISFLERRSSSTFSPPLSHPSSIFGAPFLILSAILFKKVPKFPSPNFLEK